MYRDKSFITLVIDRFQKCLSNISFIFFKIYDKDLSTVFAQNYLINFIPENISSILFLSFYPSSISCIQIC